MDESRLTQKQRKWLDASRKIGPGPMTKTERELLERLYAEMLPSEQQELYQYIQEMTGKQEEQADDPIAAMERRVWSQPSRKLLNTLGQSQKIKGPKLTEKS